MTSNSPRGKSFTLWNLWGSNISPRYKGNYCSNLPPRLGGAMAASETMILVTAAVKMRKSRWVGGSGPPKLLKTTSSSPPPSPLTPPKNRSRSWSLPQYWHLCQRSGDISPYIVVFFVVLLILDHAPSPNSILNAGSKRMIYSDASVVASEVKVKQASGKLPGMNKPTPSLFYPPPTLLNTITCTHTRYMPQ